MTKLKNDFALASLSLHHPNETRKRWRRAEPKAGSESGSGGGGRKQKPEAEAEAVAAGGSKGRKRKRKRWRREEAKAGWGSGRGSGSVGGDRKRRPEERTVDRQSDTRLRRAQEASATPPSLTTSRMTYIFVRSAGVDGKNS